MTKGVYMTWFKVAITTIFGILVFITSVSADDTFVQIQEMVNDLGGQGMINKNNGKVIKCANGGTKKITIKDGSYQAVYKNCREYGSTRDGEKFISIGEDEDAPVKKSRFSKDPTVEDTWNIIRSEKNRLAVMTSGSVELSFNDNTEVLKDVKGLPDLKPFLSKGYRHLNKNFGVNYKPSGKDETVAILKFIPQVYDFDRNTWDFCKEQESPKQKRNCNMTPYADAASIIVNRYNEGSLEPLIETYLYATKYSKNKASFKKGGDFISFVKWCTYDECRLASDVYTDKGNAPSDEAINQAFDYLNYLEWASSNPKITRNVLKDDKNNIVDGADEPEMYKTALNFLAKQYEKSKETVTKAKSKANIFDLFKENEDAARVKWIAIKLQNEFNLSENAALDMAVHSVYSIGMVDGWRSNSSNVLRKITFYLWADKQANGNDTNRSLYKGITIDGKRAIMRGEVTEWMEELKSKALKAEIEENEKILAKDQKNLKALMLLGYDYIEDGQPQKAIDAYEKALSVATEAPDRVYILNGIGYLCINAKQYEKAITTLEQALKIDEKYLYALGNMGYVYVNLNQSAKAAEYWNKYLSIDSISPTAIKIKQELVSLKGAYTF